MFDFSMLSGPSATTQVTVMLNKNIQVRL